MQTFLDFGEVEKIDNTIPADLLVVNAARVSFAKTKETFDDADRRLISYLARNEHWTPFGHARFGFSFFKDEVAHPSMLDWASSEGGAGFEIRSDEGMVNICGSLWGWLRGKPPIGVRLRNIFSELHRAAPVSTEALLGVVPASAVSPHVVPSRHVTLRIKAPIFVFRQLMRSNHGIVYNETSRRYVDEPVQVHRPIEWRGRPSEGIKQGSGSQIEYDLPCYQGIMDCMHLAEESYDHAIQAGVAPEQARIVLPMSTYSELWATFTEAALARVLRLRSTDASGKNHAQLEIRLLADAIRNELRI
jgi:thymidylate synthase (FAD)